MNHKNKHKYSEIRLIVVGWGDSVDLSLFDCLLPIETLHVPKTDLSQWPNLYAMEY